MKIKYLVITVVLATAILCFAPITKVGAVTMAELQAQINALLAQLQALQAAQQTTPVAWCHTFNVNLRIGDTNATEVSSLQIAISKDSGIAMGDTGNSGVFDEYLASAVTAFQEKYASEILVPNGLTHGNGYVGPATRAKLNVLYRCRTTPPACVDSDGGLNVNVYGTASDSQGRNMADTCVDANTISEKFCSEGIAVADTRTCPNGCSNGACVQSATPSITVTSPNGGETWQIGQTYNVTWQSNGVGLVYPIWYGYDSAGNVINSYALYQIVNGQAIGISAGQGRLSWTIPSAMAANPSLARSKINIYTGGPMIGMSDASNNYFSIVPAGTLPSITVTSPNGGETWSQGSTHNITWTSIGLGSTNVELYYRTPLGDYAGIASYIAASAGSYSWVIPSGLSGQSSKIYIRAMNSPTYSEDYSNNYFSIVAPTTTTTCTETDGGINYYQKGTTTWPGSAGYSDVRTDYCVDSNRVAEYNCEWIASEPVANYYTCPNGCENGACAPATPSITVTSPNGGEQWVVGTTHNITWRTVGITEGVAIALDGLTERDSNTGDYYAYTINIAPITSTSTSYLWTIPSNIPAARYRIKIWNTYNADPLKTIIDYSDNYFSIVAPTTTACTDPDGGLNYYTKGTTTGIYSNCTDSCTVQSSGESWVSECSCGVTGWPEAAAVRCPNGYSCQDGACKTVLTPSITVTSPNGGETFVEGQPMTITWTSGGVDKVYIYWETYSATGTIVTRNTIVSQLTASLGTYTWNIPVGFTTNKPNAARMKIFVAPPNVSTVLPGDRSDNYFSIAFGIVYNVSDSQLASISDALAKIAQQIQALLAR